MCLWLCVSSASVGLLLEGCGDCLSLAAVEQHKQNLATSIEFFGLADFGWLNLVIHLAVVVGISVVSDAPKVCSFATPDSFSIFESLKL